MQSGTKIMRNEGNVLSFTPPGLSQVLHIKFPDCRLAVCEKCKKNYKTRDMCRVRNKHRDPPWSTAFICITLDETCTDSTNKLVDGHFNVKLIKAKPFCIKKNFDSKTPVCTTCKKTNRTRSFCRQRHQHKLLPWCTVYVVLSAEADNSNSNDMETKEKIQETHESPLKLENIIHSEVREDKIINNGNEEIKDNHAGTSNSIQGPSKELTAYSTAVPNSKEKKSNGETKEIRGGNDDNNKIDQNVSNVANKHEIEPGPTKSPHTNEIKNDEIENGTTSDSIDSTVKGDENENEKNIATNYISDDINDVDESRTFLAQVSCKYISIQWLDEAEDDLIICSSQPFSNARAMASTNQSPMLLGAMPTLSYPYYPHFQMQGIAHRQALHMQNQQLLQQQAQFAAQQAFRAQYNHQMHMAIANGQQTFVPNVTTLPTVPGIPITSPNGSSCQASTKLKPQQNEVSQVDQSIANNEIQSPNHAQIQEQQWRAQIMYQQQIFSQQLSMQHQILMPKPGTISNLQNIKQPVQSDALSQLKQMHHIAKFSEASSPQVVQQSQISPDFQAQIKTINGSKETINKENEKRKKNEVYAEHENKNPSNKTTEPIKKKKKE